MNQKQVAVIGGGVVGVCTAYFLASQGHEVAVIERHQNVGQEGSFAHAGLIAPGHLAPFGAPGVFGRLLGSIFHSESAFSFTPRLDRALWKWLAQMRRESEVTRFRTNAERMKRLALYSRTLLGEMRTYYQLEYERTDGLTQLFRSAHDFKRAQAEIALLSECGIPFTQLDGDAVRVQESGLSIHTPVEAAIHLPQDEAGNCPAFTRRLKEIASTLGVQFLHGNAVTAIEHESRGLSVSFDGESFAADAVVVAAGASSAALLKPLGIDIPLLPMRSYSITATIRDYDCAPRGIIVDHAYQTAITRMGSRIRIAGNLEIGGDPEPSQQRALRTLTKIATDWFPQAAQYGNLNTWSGVHSALPDSVPLLGATRIAGLYLNVGHLGTGWSTAVGSGKLVADIISETQPDIDIDGLTLQRYGQT